MENQPLLPDQEIPITLDTRMLRDIVRRKAGRLALIGGGVCGLFMAQQLLLSPQAFKAEVSIAIQQPSGGVGGGLGALLGGGGAASKKYIGLLRSRNLADIVERQANLQSFYHFKTHREALNLLMENMKPEDNVAEGLLMARLTLPAPPALAPDPEEQRAKVKPLVAKCANMYVKALQDYYEQSSSERDNVIQQNVIAETQRVQADYREATDRIRAFVSGLDRVPAMSAPSGGMNPEMGGASQNMAVLYQDQDKVEADIRAAEAIEQAQRRLTADQLQNLSSLPAEDILLQEARAAQHSAERALKRKQDLYGPDYPQVRDAKDNLRRANEELERQKEGIQELRTTDQVDLTKRLEGLRAKRKTIADRIARMEGSVSTKRGLTSQLEFLRNEQAVALKEREAAEAKAVEIRMSAVSGRSIISIVDYAIPPLQGSPGKLRTLLLGLLLGGLAMGMTAVVEYLRLARSRALEALHFALSMQHATPEPPHKNGAQASDAGATYQPKQKK